jgi:hypothetical protein
MQLGELEPRTFNRLGTILYHLAKQNQNNFEILLSLENKNNL